MIVLVNRFLLGKNFSGITLWPFIILKDSKFKKDVVMMNHERIHLRQQAELLVVFFYIWYSLEYLIRLIQYRNRYEAYKNISFEREAYSNEKDLQYANRRPFWKFIKYL